MFLVLALVFGEMYGPNVSAVSGAKVTGNIEYREIGEGKAEIIEATDDFDAPSVDLGTYFGEYEEIYILDSAFKNFGIERIDGAEKIKSIGDGAFSGCPKLDVSGAIGENVGYIGINAFDDSVISGLAKNKVTVVNGWLLKVFAKCTQTTLKSQDISHIACGAFSDSGLSSAKFKDESKFSCNDGFIIENSDAGGRLVEVLPKKVTETVTVPDTVSVIGAHAFVGCDSVNMVNVGSQVKTVNSKAFYGCSKLGYIVITSAGTVIEDDIVKSDSSTLLCLPTSFDATKINFNNENIRFCNELLLDEDNYEIYALKSEADDDFLTIQEGKCYKVLNKKKGSSSISFRLKDANGDSMEGDYFFACNGNSLTCENGTYYINNIESDVKISLLGRGVELKDFDINKLYANCVPEGSGDLVMGVNEKSVTRAVLNDSNYDYDALNQDQAYNRGIARWGEEYVILSAKVNGMDLNKANTRTNGALYVYKDGVLDKCVYLENAPGQLCVCGDYMLVGSSFELYDLSPLKEGNDPIKVANLSNFLSGTGACMAKVKYQEKDAVIFVDVEGKAFISNVPEDNKTFVLREISMDKDEDKFTTCACSLIADKPGSLYLIEMKDQIQGANVLFKNIENACFNDKVRLSELVFESEKKIRRKYIKDFNIESDKDAYSRHVRFGSCAEYVDKDNVVLLVSSAFCGSKGFMVLDGKTVSAEYGAININIHKRSNDSKNYGNGFIPLSISNNGKWDVGISDVDGASADFVLAPGENKQLYVGGSKDSSNINGYYGSGYYKSEKTWIPENIPIGENRSINEAEDGVGYKCLLSLKNFKKLKISSDEESISCVKIQLENGEYVCNDLDINAGSSFKAVLLNTYGKIKGIDVISANGNKYCVVDQTFDESGVCDIKATFKVSYNNWMRSVENETPISMINVPGTHDSGTVYTTVGEKYVGNILSFVVGTTFAGCQNRTVAGQLAAGIRCLDVRLEGDGIDNGLTSPYYNINHGSAKCWLNIKMEERLTVVHIMEWAKEFLEKNPSETILMKLDKKLQSDHPLFKQYESIIYKEKRIPTLGEARKKVVIFMGSGAECGISVSWGGNTKFSKDPEEAAGNSVSWHTYAQDCYKGTTPEQKWEIIKNFYVELSEYDPTEYDVIINFTSATNTTDIPGLGKIPIPWLVAKTVNPNLLEYLKTCPSVDVRLGILYMDFPTKDIIKEIIRTNSITLN